MVMKCCDYNKTKKVKRCIRGDGRVFLLPRQNNRDKKDCVNPRGFTMKSSCAPFKNCGKSGGRKRKRRRKSVGKSKKQEFLFNPNNPSKSFDVYIDKNPEDTIPIKYTTVGDVQDTIQRLERLYKEGAYPHKRIFQVAMILMVRLRVLKDKKPKQYALAQRYYEFVKSRTPLVEDDRKKLRFKMRLNRKTRKNK